VDVRVQSPHVLRYRFGPYEVDTARNELRKFGLRIPLERKPRTLLIALLRRPGKLVSRQELRLALWEKNVFVDYEHGLNVAITKLRAALSDSAESPAYIETVAGEGYRFVSNVETLSTPYVGPADGESCLSRHSEQPVRPADSFSASGNSTGFRRWAMLTAVLLALTAGVPNRHDEMLAPPHSVTVLIGAFQNTTGEPMLDGTLHFALERELSNSGSVRVISPERLQDILKLMRHPAVSEPDRALGLDICHRIPGLRALITGRVQKLGGQYHLMAEIIDPADGTTLRAEESQAPREQEILAAVHSLAVQVRSDVVDNLSAFPLSAPPIEQVTTSSLRALHLYSEAAGLMINRGSEAREESMQLLQHALKEDPDFASAHIMLAWLLSNSTVPSNEHFERAFALADSVSERERLFIVGSYYQVRIISPGDASALKAMAAYEELLRYFPDDFWTIDNLAEIYTRAGRAREAWLLEVRMAEVRPESTEQELPYLWSRLVAIGETSSAQRLVALCNSRRDVPQCMEVLITRDFFPIWHAIRLGQLEEAVGLAERTRDQYATSEQAATSTVQAMLSEVYEDLGMFQKELEVARNSQDARTHLRIPAAVAYLRGDTTAENSALSELVQHLNLTSLGDVMTFAVLGRFREAELVIAAHKNWPVQMRHLARGYVELEQGNITVSLRDLREGDVFYKQLHSDAACETSDALATALESVGETDQAINVMVEAEAQLANQSERAFVDPWNLIARQHLARLYRRAGNIAEATVIEAELRAQLRLSEPGHIVLRALPQALSYQAALN